MNLQFFKQDLLASFVVFLVALPLCMGIAIASGVPPAAGLISGVIGGILVGALSGSPLQVSGPAAGLAVLVFEIVQEQGLGGLAIICVAAGAIQIVAGLLKTGQVFRAISPAVIYGMLAGIGILILTAQLHVMVDDKPRANGLKSMLAIPESIMKAMSPEEGGSSQIAALLGIGTIALLVLWNKYSPTALKSVPGALVGVASATAIATFLKLPMQYVKLNGSFADAIHFPQMQEFSNLASIEVVLLALTVAFVASAETLLSASAVDQMHSGARTRYNKELIAQGVGNMVAGLVGGIPMTGVIVRSATNVTAGAKTRLSAIFHGLWLLLLVASAPWLLRMVPTASLAAVLVYTGFKLINLQNVRRLLRYGGAPVLIYSATLVGIVTVDLLTGILIGLALSIAKVIYARTHLRIRTESNPLIPRHDVYLGGAATFMRLPQLRDTLDKIPAENNVHLHFRELDYVDDAALEAISEWEHQRKTQGFTTMLEWSEALTLYREKNPLGNFQRADVELTTGAH